MSMRMFALWIVLSSFVQGCTVSTESMVDTHIQGSATPTIDVAATTPPPTFFASAAVSPIASPSQTSINTLPATPEPVQTVQPACFTTLLALPDTKTYHGKIIFLSNIISENVQESYHLASIYDLNTRMTMPMNIEHTNTVGVSPDRSKYAAVDATDETVKIFTASGHLLKFLPPSDFPYSIDDWLNNEQLVLVILEPWFGTYYKYPFDQLIFNPSTGEQKRMISEQYPDIDVANARMFWEGGSTTEYDPLLSRVVYPAEIKEDYLGKSGIGYVLWDLENQIKLVEIVTGYFSVTPKWVPDGSRFVINDNYGVGEFYAVTRDGVVTQLSHMNSDIASVTSGVRYFSDLYSWSPDGRYLAFWLESRQNSSIKGTFAVLDTETGTVIDTCVSAGFEGKNVPHLDGIYLSPIWSPDGKSIVTQANKREDGGYQSVLIDLEDKYAAVLTENKFPVGWLADGGD